MTERRFNQDEVAAIFEIAAESQHTNQPTLPTSEGLTLAQLQEIGREVGLSPGLIDNASRSLSLSTRPSEREFLTLPIGVALTMDLPRNLTDAEWERVVVDLRETFDARGRVSSEGEIRQWRHGNLQAHLEPTPNGQRIRLRTYKGNARELIIGGLAMLGFAAVATITAAMRGPITDLGMLTGMFTLGAGGAALAAMGALPLRAWARLRRNQMEGVAARIGTVANSPTPLNKV